MCSIKKQPDEIPNELMDAWDHSSGNRLVSILTELQLNARSVDKIGLAELR
jgi:hypothetical protein